MRLLVTGEVRKEGKTKRHEFSAIDGRNDAFIVFEGKEDEPFWRREGDGIRFVYTDLDFATALMLTNREPNKFSHKIFETDFEEFYKYFEEAHSNHQVPIR